MDHKYLLLEKYLNKGQIEEKIKSFVKKAYEISISDKKNLYVKESQDFDSSDLWGDFDDLISDVLKDEINKIQKDIFNIEPSEVDKSISDKGFEKSIAGFYNNKNIFETLSYLGVLINKPFSEFYFDTVKNNKDISNKIFDYCFKNTDLQRENLFLIVYVLKINEILEESVKNKNFVELKDILANFITKYALYSNKIKNILTHISGFIKFIEEISRYKELKSVLEKKINKIDYENKNIGNIYQELKEFVSSLINKSEYSKEERNYLENLLNDYLSGLGFLLKEAIEEIFEGAEKDYHKYGHSQNIHEKINAIWIFYVFEDILEKSTPENLVIFHKFYIKFKYDIYIALEKYIKNIVEYKTTQLVNAVKTEALSKFITEFSLIGFSKSIKGVVDSIKSKIDLKNTDKLIDEVILAFKKSNKYFSLGRLVFIITRNHVVNLLRTELIHGLHENSKNILQEIIYENPEIHERLKFFTIKKSSSKINEIRNIIKENFKNVINITSKDLTSKIFEIAKTNKITITDEEGFLMNFIRKIKDTDDINDLADKLKFVYFGYRIATSSAQEEEKVKNDLKDWAFKISNILLKFHDLLKSKNNVLEIDLKINNIENSCFYFNVDDSNASKNLLFSTFSDIFDIYKDLVYSLLEDLSPQTKKTWKREKIIKSIHRAAIVDIDELPETIDKIVKLNEDGDYEFDKLEKLNSVVFDNLLIKIARTNELQKEKFAKVHKTPMSINITRSDEELISYAKLNNVLGEKMYNVALTNKNAISENKTEPKFNIELQKNQGLVFVKKFFADIADIYQIIDKEKIDRKGSYFYNKARKELFADIAKKIKGDWLTIEPSDLSDDLVDKFIDLVINTSYKSLKGPKSLYDRVIKAAIENGKRLENTKEFREKVKDFIINFFLNVNYRERPLRSFLLFKDLDFRKGVIPELISVVNKFSKEYKTIKTENAFAVSLSRFRAYFSNDLLTNKLNSFMTYLRALENFSEKVWTLCHAYNQVLEESVKNIKVDPEYLKNAVLEIITENQMLVSMLKKETKLFAANNTINVYSTFIFSVFKEEVFKDNDLSKYFNKIKEIFDEMIEKTNEETEKVMKKISGIYDILNKNINALKDKDLQKLNKITKESVLYEADFSFFKKIKDDLIEIIENIEKTIIEKNKVLNYSANFNVYASNIDKLLEIIGKKLKGQEVADTEEIKKIEETLEYIYEIMKQIRTGGMPLSSKYIKENTEQNKLNVIDQAIKNNNHLMLINKMHRLIDKNDLDRLIKLGEDLFIRYNIVSPKDFKTKELLNKVLKHYINLLIPFFEETLKKEESTLYEYYLNKSTDGYIIEQVTKEMINYYNINKKMLDKKEKVKLIFNKFKEKLKNSSLKKKIVLNENQQEEELQKEQLYQYFIEEIASKLNPSIRQDFVNIIKNNVKLNNAIKKLVIENNVDPLVNLIYQVVVSLRNNEFVAQLIFVMIAIMCNIKNFSLLNFSRIQSQSQKLQDLLKDLKEDVTSEFKPEIKKELIFKELKETAIPSFIIAVSSNSYWVSKALKFIETETLDANIFSEFFVYEDNIKRFLESSKHGLITMCAKILPPEGMLHSFLKKMNNFLTQERIEKIGVPSFKQKISIGSGDDDASIENFIDNYLYKKGYYDTQ